ncbi:MAG: hypothetical protein WBQ18_11120 [Solirubrobacteraceae bacterium]
MSTIRRRITPAATALTAAVSIGIAAASLGATASAAPVAPTVTTTNAVAVATSSESILGTVNPNGSPTRYYFQYGPTTTYGSTTPTHDAGSGSTALTEAESLNGLTPGSVYHYRLVAVGPGGTSQGVDETFTAGGTSAVKVLGREGFVSPGGVIGIQIGCFGGVSTCTGNFTVTHGSTLVGEHSYSIAPDTGGFHNFKLTPAGEVLLSHNSVNNLLGVTVTVKDNSGPTTQFVVHLAKWFWHA